LCHRLHQQCADAGFVVGAADQFAKVGDFLQLGDGRPLSVAEISRVSEAELSHASPLRVGIKSSLESLVASRANTYQPANATHL
jgi:hypothetical protein